MQVYELNTLYEHIKPLGDRIEMFFPSEESLYEVKTKNIRLSSFSDQLVSVSIQWFYKPDINTKLSETQIKATSVWRCDNYLCNSSYFRIHVINNTQQPHMKFTLSPLILCNSEKNIKTEQPRAIQPIVIDTIEKTKEQKEESRINDSIDRRTKSPGIFRKWTNKKESNHNGHVEIKDTRLPSLLFPGSLLYVDKHKNIKCLPIGEIDNILKVDSDKMPTWCFEYPPKQLSTESKKRLSVQFTTNKNDRKNEKEEKEILGPLDEENDNSEKWRFD